MKHKALLIFFTLLMLENSFAVEAKLTLSPCSGNCLLQEFEDQPVDSSQNVSPFRGSYESYISQKCHYKNIESFYKFSASNKELGAQLTDWLKQCEPELARYNTSSVLTMLKLNYLDYDFNNNPKIQQVKIVYDQKTIVTGLLVLKDTKRRPLVIVKNGVFGNAEDTSTVRNMLMHFSEESPFHVLILGNLTGDDFIKDNGYIAVGGFEEGRQIHKVVDILLEENSPVKNFIHDIHMLGISLGGNGAYFSALYNEFVEESKKIKSHIAYCPVANLERSLNHVYQPKGLGVLFSFITKRLLYDLLSFVPHLQDIFNPDEKLKSKMVKGVLVEGAIRSLKERTNASPWDMQPFVGAKINNESDLWKYNDFNLYVDQVKEPLLVIHSADDFVVTSQHNSNPLRSVASHKQNVGFVNLNQGGHCSFSLAYGWPTFSKLLQQYVLSHSTYDYAQESRVVKIKYQQSPMQNSRYRFAKYEWIYNQSKKSFDLRMSYRMDHMPVLRGNAKCSSQDYRFSDSACYFHQSYSVDASVFAELGIVIPNTSFETSTLNRVLNTHLIPVDEKGEIPYGKGQSPTHLVYRSAK